MKRHDSAGRWSVLVAGAPVVALLTALAFRLPQLELRPMHGDEANQAVKTGALLERGFYEYDPVDHHGPTLYYLARISAWLRGEDTLVETTESTYRIVSVVFGIGTVLLVFALRHGIGPAAAVCAAMLTAVSPAQSYYSRYFIQEPLLVFFTLALIVCAWRYSRAPGYRWAVGGGLAFGLMHATKETCVIAWAAMLAAAGVLALMRRRDGEAANSTRTWRHAGAAAAIAVLVSVMFFSSFFSHVRGPLDSVLTYGNYLARGSAPALHDKPWHYYLGLMAWVDRGPGGRWSEGFILVLACAGAFTAFRRTNGGTASLPRFLTLYAAFITLLYSLIPYKTPWSMLSLHHALILVAGVGAAGLVERARAVPARAIVSLLIAAGTAQLGIQAYRANITLPADPRNPYVYAHTSTAFLRLVGRVNDIAAVHEAGAAMPIKVIQPDEDYWPLPWYLRGYTRAGYWTTIPETGDAAVIVADPALNEALAAALGDAYVTETQGLRPSVLRTVYIRRDLWEAFMETRLQ